MPKELLIDASHPEETRIAIKSNNGIEEYEYENIHRKNLKGNIYLGKVSRIEPSLQAAFVDFGNERHGFLAFNDIQSDYYQIPQADKDRIKKEEEEARAKLLEENDKEIIENTEQSEDINYKTKIHLMEIKMKKALEIKHLIKTLIQMKKIILKINLKTTKVFTDSKDIVFKK